MESVLITIKKLLGIAAEYKHFDDQIVAYINSTFVALYHLGVLKTPKFVSSELETWTDIFGENVKDIDMIKVYVKTKVQVMFDPPTSSFVLEAMNRQIDEMEWRLNSMADVEAKAETSD